MRKYKLFDYEDGQLLVTVVTDDENKPALKFTCLLENHKFEEDVFIECSITATLKSQKYLEESFKELTKESCLEQYEFGKKQLLEFLEDEED